MSSSRPVAHAELLENLTWIRALARGLVGDPSRADDVAQEALVAALERPPRASSGASLRAWLARVTRTAAKDSARSETRRGWRERLGARPEAQPSAGDVVERTATQRAVVDAVLALDEPERSTVLWRYVDGLSAAEIAKRRGENASAVRKRLSRALDRLRARLAEEHGGRDELARALAPLAALGNEGGGAALGLSPIALGAAGLAVALSAVLLARVLADRSDDDRALEVAALVPPRAGATARAVEPPSGERVPIAANPQVAHELEGSVVRLAYRDVAQHEAPVADVAVEASLSKRHAKETWRWESTLSETLTTDGDGRFRWSFEDPGYRPMRVALAVAADDLHRLAAFRVVVEEGDALPTEARLARAVHGHLEVIVTSDDGRPLEAALVAFDDRAGDDLRVREGTTGEDGRVVFRDVRNVDGLRAELPGWSSIDTPSARREQAGGWTPVRVVLVPAGSLTLTVRDARGAPVPGVSVTLDVSEDEPLARRELSWGDTPRKLHGETDASGTITLHGVWTGVKLALEVRTQQGAWRSERVADGVLAIEHGDALVVPSRGALEVVAVLPEPSRLRGRVVHPDGSPAMPGGVILRPQLRGDARRSTLGVAAGEDGAFEWSFLSSAPVESVDVTAFEHRGKWDPDFAFDRPDVTASTARRVSAAELEAGEPIELVLGPTLSIAGHVRHADGTPARGNVRWENAADGGLGTDFPRERIEEDGSFEISGLRPGVHTLSVELRDDYFFTWSKNPRRFPGIAAGARNVELVLGEPESVRITIAATLDGEPVAFDAVLGQHDPAFERAKELAPSELTVARLDGWPEPATLAMGGGQAGASDSLGKHRFMYLGRAQGDTFALPEVAPGWYWIGVRGHVDGKRLHPSGAGLHYFEPGEYAFHFELARAGELRGRIVAPRIAPDLAVALVDAAGKAVQTQRTSSQVDTVSPTGADGSFLLQGAPVGTFTLRVGRESELRGGRAMHSQSVTIEPGGNPVVEVRLR